MMHGQKNIKLFSSLLPQRYFM